MSELLSPESSILLSNIQEGKAQLGKQATLKQE